MANPRKFAEKIALHAQKQAEGTAAFNEVMAIPASKLVKMQPDMQSDNYGDMMMMRRNWNDDLSDGLQNNSGVYQKNHLHIVQSLGAYRGGSLPNVNQMSNSSIDLQSALHNLEDMKHGRENYGDRVHRERGRHVIPHRNRQFMIEKRIDVSPYGSTSYLSPPPDTNWRRTNSDSALHQSAMAPQENFNSANTSPTQRRGTVHEMDSGTFLLDTGQMKEYWDTKDTHLIATFQARPKSCEVPGNNLFPTQEDPNIVHPLSLSNNTSSLPDLTNLDFTVPLGTALDTEDQSVGNPGSPYSQPTPPRSSPLSPSLVNQQSHVIGPSMVSGGTLIHSPQSSGGGSISPGPILTNSISTNSINNIGGVNQLNHHSSTGNVHSPASRRRQHQLSNIVITGGGALNNGSVMASSIGNHSHHNHHFSHHNQHQQQQSLPPQVCLQRFRQDPPPPRITVEGLAIDTNALSLDPFNSNQVYGLYQQQPQSPTHQTIQQNYRPSSPSLPQMKVVNYRSTSPSEHSCSAPTSPVSHSHSPASSPGLGPVNSLSKSPFTDTNCFIHQQQANVLQHQLEQFRMVAESPPLQVQQQHRQHHQQQQQQQQHQTQMMHQHQQLQQQTQHRQQDHEQFLLMHDGSPVCTSSSPTTPPSPGVYLAGLGGGGCNQSDLTLSPSGQRLVNNHNGLCESIGCGDSGLIDSDSVYYSIPSSTCDIMIPQSPTYYSKSSVVISSSSLQTTPQTPQTPTSIPDIILTAPDQLLRQDFAKDLGSAMASMPGSFDSDIFSNDEVLRPIGVLDQIDFEGFHMLSEADSLSVIGDSVGDDAYHLGRS